MYDEIVKKLKNEDEDSLIKNASTILLVVIFCWLAFLYFFLQNVQKEI